MWWNFQGIFPGFSMQKSTRNGQHILCRFLDADLCKSTSRCNSHSFRVCDFVRFYKLTLTTMSRRVLSTMFGSRDVVMTMTTPSAKTCSRVDVRYYTVSIFSSFCCMRVPLFAIIRAHNVNTFIRSGRACVFRGALQYIYLYIYIYRILLERKADAGVNGLTAVNNNNNNMMPAAYRSWPNLTVFRGREIKNTHNVLLAHVCHNVITRIIYLCDSDGISGAPMFWQ